MREEMIQMIEREKIIAIVRGVEAEECLKVADALYEGGIRLMEVTFNHKKPDSFKATADTITKIDKKYEGRIMIGAGTVTEVELVELAASAGAKYIISPDVNSVVIRRTRQLGLVSIPGALTPSEIMTAHRAGADFVKLFPIGEFGVSYVKAVRAPISHVKLLAVGGVDENNAAEFLKADIAGIGIGGNLVNTKWIEAGEYSKITEAARNLTAIVRSV